MRYNNNYSPTDTITVVLPASIAVDKIFVYRYVVGSTKQPESFTTEVIGNFIYVHIPAIMISCHLLIEYGSGGTVVRIGEPPTVMFTYYQNLTNEYVPYKQYDYNSNLLASGYMAKVAEHFYAILVTKVVRSFFDISGSIITLTTPEKYSSVGSDFASGSITLQRGCWQLIAIPSYGKVKDIFLDALATQTGVPITSLVEVVSAYPGQVNKFLSFKPGVTAITSEHNFNLTTIDGGSKEITGFWVKCLDWQHTTDNIVFNWTSSGSGAQDGVI